MLIRRKKRVISRLWFIEVDILTGDTRTISPEGFVHPAERLDVARLAQREVRDLRTLAREKKDLQQGDLFRGEER